MTLPKRTDLYVDTTRVDTVVVTGLEFELNPNWLANKTKAFIRCTRVTLPQNLKFKSGELFIAAREVVCAEDGSVIDVSGAVGSPNHTSTAKPGSGPGKKGGDGADGGLGEHGGRVEINAIRILGDLKILAHGGPGGGAQNGGHGAPGRNAVPPVCDGAKSKAAGRGGAAGIAGRPGDGGTGGVVEISYWEAPNGTPSADVSGGIPGRRGIHGSPGKGGKSTPDKVCYWTHHEICTPAGW